MSLSRPRVFSNSTNTSFGSSDSNSSTLITATFSTKKLLVSNLPKLLFNEVRDLYPLFRPFGQIGKAEYFDTGSMSADLGHTAAIVEFLSVESSREAKNALQGQTWGDTNLDVIFLATEESCGAGLVDG